MGAFFGGDSRATAAVSGNGAQQMSAITEPLTRFPEQKATSVDKGTKRTACSQFWPTDLPPRCRCLLRYKNGSGDDATVAMLAERWQRLRRRRGLSHFWEVIFKASPPRRSHLYSVLSFFSPLPLLVSAIAIDAVLCHAANDIGDSTFEHT